MSNASFPEHPLIRTSSQQAGVVYESTPPFGFRLLLNSINYVELLWVRFHRSKKKKNLMVEVFDFSDATVTISCANNVPLFL